MDTIDYDSFTDLFPMPMTSIEKFHYWDCDSDLPNVIHFRMRLATRLDPSIAKKAWQLAMERQPFSDVEPKKSNGRWVWKAGPRGLGDQNRSFETWNGTGFKFSETDPSATPQDRVQHRIRSSTGSSLEICVWPQSSAGSLDGNPTPDPNDATAWHSEAYFFVHHAIADGAAAMMVINEWILIYTNLGAGRPPSNGLHRLDPELMKSRGNLGLLEWRYLKHIPKQVVALFGAAKFTFRKTVELIPGKRLEATRRPGVEGKGQKQFPAIVGNWLSESQLEQLNQVARQNGVMLNSVLLAQLYIALAQWRTKLGVHSDLDWIRIIVPMSVRNISDRRLPAANRATIVQIDRRGAECNDVPALYRSLNREIRIIRGWYLEKIFLIAIGCLSGFESFLKRAAGNERSRGMAVFTNLGEPLRKSHRSLQRDSRQTVFEHLVSFDPIGPIRKGTPVNFTVSRFNERLRVSLHYDATVLSSDQAESLVTQYVAQLNSVSGSRHDTG